MHRLYKAISTPTARSTAFYYVGSFAQNVLRYFFHLILLRLLVPALYGEYLSYLSLMYLLSIPMGTISGVVTKFVAEFKGRGDNTSINLFFYYLLKKISPITFVLGFLLIVFANSLATIFKAHSIAFIILGVSMLITLYQTIISSYLVAFQKFVFQTIIGFVTVLTTIVFAIIFIRIGFGATGAVIGQLLAGLFTSLIIFFNIKSSIVPKIKTKTSPKFSLAGFTGYSFLYALGTMSLISVDILIARIYFDPITSGLYSALSILGRMILFGLTPLISLVLPIASHRHAISGSAKSVLLKLGAIILLLGLIGSGIFSLFPTLVIRVLSGSAYLVVAPFLSVFAISMVFFALSQFILSYFMATGKPQTNIFLLIASLAQPVALYLVRGSFFWFIWAGLIIQSALLTSLLITLFFPSDRNN